MGSKIQYDVSFVIPVYNVEKYLKNCLDSVMAQRGIAKEVIVIDDGSCDRSVQILKKYEKRCNNIMFIQQDHQGASVARNRGITAASGEWICFIDSDDYLEPDCMCEILKAAANDQDVIFADYAKIRDGKKEVYSYANGQIALEKKDFELYQRATLNKKYSPNHLQVITPWAKLYRRDFLLKNKIYFTPGVRKSQDVLFNFEVYYFAQHGKYVPILMYDYRYHSESLCHKYLPGVLNDYLKQSQKIELLLKKYGTYSKLKQDYYYRVVVNYLFSILLDYTHKDNKKSYCERKKEFVKSLEYQSIKRAFLHVNKAEFTIAEKFLLKNIQKKNFLMIQFLYHGYLLLEKWN